MEFLSYNQESVLKSNKSVIYFSASWCGPCKQFGPVMDSVALIYNNEDDVLFFKYLADDNNSKAVLESYKVRSLPTVLFLKENKEVKRLQGMQSSKAVTDVINLMVEDDF